MKVAGFAPFLILAACNSEPEVSVRNASVEEVANQVAEATGDEGNFIRPGKWSSTMTIEELAAPGMPPEFAERMKSTMGAGQSAESCLTEEDAKKPNEDFFAGKNNQCRYEYFKMGDGKIDARMNCSQGAATQVMEMNGSYSPDTYRMRMSTTTEGASRTGGMTMKMRIDAKRIGECTRTAA